MPGERYRHTQIGWLMIGALGPAAVITTVMAALDGSALRIAIAALMLVLLASFPTLTVVGDDTGLRVSFGPGLVRRRFDWTDIRAARAVRNHWAMGWGIRMGGGGTMYNVSGLDAVELQLDDGGRFRIGTDDPRGLEAFIKEQLSRRGLPSPR